MTLARHALEGELALIEGRLSDAIASFGKATVLEDGLGYVEPPDWSQPMRLYLGAALLEAGRPAEAESIYREELARFEGLGWAPLGLSQSLEAQQRGQEAAVVRAQFEEAWRESDVRPERSIVMGASGRGVAAHR